MQLDADIERIKEIEAERVANPPKEPDGDHPELQRGASFTTRHRGNSSLPAFAGPNIAPTPSQADWAKLPEEVLSDPLLYSCMHRRLCIWLVIFVASCSLYTFI